MNRTWIDAADRMLRSPRYVITLSVLTVISNLLSLELFLYTLFILIGIFICLFGRDLLGVMPIAILCYIAPSPQNNPGSAENTGSIFYPGNGGIYLAVLFLSFLICLVYRLITDPQIGGKRFLSEKRSLLWGMLLLGGAYLLSGLGMEAYPQLWDRNLLFAAAQFAAIFALYYLLCGAVRWEEVPKDYLAWIGTCVGFVVLPQLLENYLSGRIFMEGTGTIDRELIYTGWGMHNNMGGLMAMMLPFPFYLAMHRRSGWVYTLLATLLFIGVVLSCSRTSILVAAVIYVVCAWTLLRRRPEERKANLRVYTAVLLLVIGGVVMFWQTLLDIFDLFFEELFIVSQRDNLFRYGIRQFLDHPIFGGSFFPQGEYVPWDWSTSEAFTSFFPPRWHDTLVQIAASCGTVGLVAYAFHRYQTVKLLVTDRTPEKLSIFLYLTVLLTCSLLDCHFFNIGPVLFYSMALAFAEKIHRSTV